MLGKRKIIRNGWWEEGQYNRNGTRWKTNFIIVSLFMPVPENYRFDFIIFHFIKSFSHYFVKFFALHVFFSVDLSLFSAVVIKKLTRAVMRKG